MSAPWDGRNVVYRLYNTHGTCIYIGCTKHFTSRIHQHRFSSYFGEQIARVRVTIHPDRDTAHEVEQGEIFRARPRHNINGRGKRGFWSAVDYVEVLDALRAREAAGTSSRSTGPALSYLDVSRMEAEFARRFPAVAALVLGSASVERTA